MKEMQGLIKTCQREKEEGLNYVSKYWNEESQEETSRTWNDLEVWDRHIDIEQREI